MKSLMKSQIFEILRWRMIYYIFTFCIVFSFFYTFIGGDENSPEVLGYRVAGSSSSFVFIGMIFLGFLVGNICGNDFVDKTFNYEIMFGHTRAKIYFARIILSIVLGVIGTAIIVAVPILYISVTKGFGDFVAVSVVVKRLLLYIFPVIRIICGLALVTFIVKTPYVNYVLGTVLFVIGDIIVYAIDAENYFTNALSTIGVIGEAFKWSTFSLNGKYCYIYDFSMKTSEVLGVIVPSLIFSGIYIWLGYNFFKRDDI